MNTTTVDTGTRRNTSWIALALGVVFLGLVAGPVLAGAVAPRFGSPTVPAADQPAEHTIAVVGSGKVTVVPDQATIRLGVNLERQTAKAARQAGAQAMARVVAAIRALGIADEDIATSSISLGPVYDYNNGSAPRIRGYQLTNIVTVTVRDLDVIGDVLDDGVLAGATSVQGISFDVSDRTTAEAKAREAAVQDAKAKAETLATGVGVQITGVASMSESVSTPIWYDRTFAGVAAEDASTPVLAGSTDVTISVSVTFLIS